MRWSAQTGTEDLPPSVAPQAEPGSVGMNDAPTSVEEAGSSGRVQIERSGREAEHRQLTLAFVDLVDFTALSTRLDRKS